MNYPSFEPRKLQYCYVCAQSDHLVQNCPHKRGFKTQKRQPFICYCCGGEGHIAKCCPSKFYFNSRKQPNKVQTETNRYYDWGNRQPPSTFQQAVCYRCGKLGHLAAFCRQDCIKYGFSNQALKNQKECINRDKTGYNVFTISRKEGN